jgi:Ca2+-binding RTX toxin-like protein
VIGSRARLFAYLAAGSVAAGLGLPAASPAHQVATLSGGQLTITGDQQNKLNDLITLDYDSSRDELVIGNDVFGRHPSKCTRDAVHPERIIHCPASLISAIQIDAGTGRDSVIATVPVAIQAVMGAGNDSFQGGSEVDTVRGGSGSDKASLGAGDDTASMGGGTDKAYGGPGKDTLKGAAASDKLFGQGGADWLLGGGGRDKLLAGGGQDQCNGGPGGAKQISCKADINY